MASQYWIANNPGSTVTSAQAESVAVLGRNLTTGQSANIATIISTANSGAVDVVQIDWTSNLSDPTHFLNITISPTSRILVTTAQATANGVIAGGGSTDTKGQI